MNSYFWPGLVLTVPFIGYYGYYYLRSKLKLYVIDQVLKKLDDMSNAEEIKFQPFRRTQSAMITFEHGGKQYKLCIPYDNSKSRHMRRKKVYLFRGEDRIDISHKPGVPYLLSA